MAYEQQRSHFARTLDRRSDFSMFRAEDQLFDNGKTGFLSIETNSIDTPSFSMCSQNKQCATLPFEFNGQVRTRMVYDLKEVRMWSFNDDTERCGSFGVFVGTNDAMCKEFWVGNCCKLDEAVTIHFQVACSSKDKLIVANNNKAIPELDALCGDLHWTRPNHLYVTNPDDEAS
jgi:hypothetical protein